MKAIRKFLVVDFIPEISTHPQVISTQILADHIQIRYENGARLIGRHKKVRKSIIQYAYL